MAALGRRQDALLSDAPLPAGVMGQPAMGQPQERRRRLRIDTCYPARVRWQDSVGGCVKYDATLDNLSCNGLYMRVPSQMAAGQRACVVFYMADGVTMPSGRPAADATVTEGTAAPTSAPRIAVRGSVLRSEPLEGGLWGVVVVFKQHRFL